MISYGGTPLTIGDVELHAMIDRGLDLDHLFESFSPEWSGLTAWQIPDFVRRPHTPLYSLRWPRGACRWAEGHFLATEAELDAIRQYAYTGDSRGQIPLDFVLDDGQSSITTQLYMLPPRPLFQLDQDGLKNIYLLTLVDERYYWWQKAAAITITPGTTSWTTLIADIGTALGITIDVDPIESAYLKPPIELQHESLYLPPLLDAVAYSIGTRVIRDLDGTVTLQSSTLGLAAAGELYNTYQTEGANYNFGGYFRFDDQGQRTDLPAAVPATVRSVFPKRNTTDTTDLSSQCAAAACISSWQTYDSDLTTLDISAFQGVAVRRGTKIFKTTATAWMSGSSVTNSAELQALNAQLAADWYRWQLADLSQVFAGILPWEGEGASDYVEWVATPNRMLTRVMRESMNDLAMQVYHYSANPSASSSSSSAPEPDCCDWVYTDVKTADYTAVAGEAVLVRPGGATVSITMPATPSQNDRVKVVVLYDASGGTVRTLCAGTTPADYVNGQLSTSEIISNDASAATKLGSWIFTYSAVAGVGWDVTRQFT